MYIFIIFILSFLFQLESGKSSLIYTYKNQMPPIHKINNDQTDAIIKKINYIKTSKQGHQKQHYECNIHLWDTTGDQSAEILKTILVKRSNVIILLFDRQKKISFDKMKAIWAKIQQSKKELYHIDYILIGNVRESNDKAKQHHQIKEENYYQERRKHLNPLFRKSRSFIVEDIDHNLKKSQYLKQSFVEGYDDPFSSDAEFKKQVQRFIDTEQLIYFEISVHQPNAIRQVFQNILARIMKKIEDSKIKVEDVVIKDTEGKVKLRKFDYKTYEYFEKRYNKCC